MDERILPDLWFRRELEFPRYYRDQLAVSAPSLVSLITTNDPLAMRDRGDLRPEHRFGADTTRYHILSISISDRLDNNKEPIRAGIGGSSNANQEGAQRQHTQAAANGFWVFSQVVRGRGRGRGLACCSSRSSRGEAWQKEKVSLRQVSLGPRWRRSGGAEQPTGGQGNERCRRGGEQSEVGPRARCYRQCRRCWRHVG